MMLLNYRKRQGILNSRSGGSGGGAYFLYDYQFIVSTGSRQSLLYRLIESMPAVVGWINDREKKRRVTLTVNLVS